MRVATIRKAIAAGAGVVLIGVLEWTSTSTDLGPWLEQLVPAPLVPLVAIVLGGLATVGAVYRADNAPLSSRPLTIDEPAPPADAGLASSQGDLPAADAAGTSAGTASPAAAVSSPLAAPSAAAAAAGDARPFWTGVAAGEPVASTSLVQLLPEPQAPASYQ